LQEEKGLEKDYPLIKADKIVQKLSRNKKYFLALHGLVTLIILQKDKGSKRVITLYNNQKTQRDEIKTRKLRQ
jgi:hypothetical protein